jgi:hypothetical protein
MRIVEKLESQPERVAIYGPSKTGKTQLATALPWGEKWGEEAVYVPYDPSGEALRSVLNPNRDRMRMVVPEGKPNWLEESVEIVTTNWRERWPKAKTIIIDTMTVFSFKLLRQYANSGVFSEKHAVQLGVKGTKSWHTSPMEGDYGAAQGSISYVLDLLMETQKDMNVIVVFHDDFLEPKGGNPDGLIGGPGLVGKKAVKWIPGRFDAVFRMERTSGLSGSKWVVHTAQKGIWTAGFRNGSPKTAMPPLVEISAGEQRKFWESYDSVGA